MTILIDETAVFGSQSKSCSFFDVLNMETYTYIIYIEFICLFVDANWIGFYVCVCFEVYVGLIGASM